MQAPVGFRIIASGSEFEARVEEVVLSIHRVRSRPTPSWPSRPGAGRGAGGGGRHGAERRSAVAPGGHGRGRLVPGHEAEHAERLRAEGVRVGDGHVAAPIPGGRNNGVRPQCCVYCTSRRKRATEPRLSSLKPGRGTSARRTVWRRVPRANGRGSAPACARRSRRRCLAAVLGQHDHVPDRGVEPVVLTRPMPISSPSSSRAVTFQVDASARSRAASSRSGSDQPAAARSARYSAGASRSPSAYLTGTQDPPGAGPPRPPPRPT